MWSSSPAIEITPEERAELERIVGSGKTEQRIAQRARIILGAAAGKSNNALAKELETSRPTVLDWRQRFAKGGVKALYEDRPRGRSFTPLVRAKEAEVVAMTQTAPTQATHWSCRRMAKICGISKASVQRIWRANGLKPHLLRTSKFSNDPNFLKKLKAAKDDHRYRSIDRVGQHFLCPQNRIPDPRSGPTQIGRPFARIFATRSGAIPSE